MLNHREHRIADCRLPIADRVHSAIGNRQSAICWSLWLIILVCVGHASAQSAPTESLQSLTDAKLMNELADRGLNSLLDRYFEAHHTPQSQQDAIKSMQALRDLANPKLSNM